jgi:hypothetical protein
MASCSGWLDEDEKYALVGLNVNLAAGIPTGRIADGLWVLTDRPFTIPTHWRDWLGKVRSDQVEDCNLFLMSKLASKTPGVLDAENKQLALLVSHFYTGLVLASNFAAAHEPVLLSGACQHGEIDIRQQQDFEAPVSGLVQRFPPITAIQISLAAHLAESIGDIPKRQLPGGHSRLFRMLYVYMEARTKRNLLDRIHQYCRCLEGLILSAPGKSKQQFRSRTELFIGQGHHDMMGALYDIRSDVEHLHDYLYFETYDRARMLGIVRNEAIVENIARATMAKIIGNQMLCTHFANSPALEQYWSMDSSERRRIWGNAIDPLQAVVDFDPLLIGDEELKPQ